MAMGLNLNSGGPASRINEFSSGGGLSIDRSGTTKNTGAATMGENRTISGRMGASSMGKAAAVGLSGGMGLFDNTNR